MTFATILSLINQYSLWLYAVGFLALLLTLYELRSASRSRAETIFSLEKELASARENRARSALILVLALLSLLTVVRFAIVPSQSLALPPTPTPTRFFLQPPTPVPSTPTPTLTRIPTRPRPTPMPPTETPTPTMVPPPPCPRPGICITSPLPDQTISGTVSVQGTASIEPFQFYKMEYGLGEIPEQWHSIGSVSRTPVVNGTLVVWDTSGFPNGVAWLRLTVVDVSGNFPPPFEVRVTIQN
jgi:hypothetical protein